jgi:hypothetical protein
MHWAEASRLEQSDFKKSKFYPLKLNLRKWTGTGTSSGFLVFWYQSKLGFHFSGGSGH